MTIYRLAYVTQLNHLHVPYPVLSINLKILTVHIIQYLLVIVTIVVIVGQYRYMNEPFEEENDVNTGLDSRGLHHQINGKKQESKVFLDSQKRELDSPRPSAFI